MKQLLMLVVRTWFPSHKVRHAYLQELPRIGRVQFEVGRERQQEVEFSFYWSRAPRTNYVHLKKRFGQDQSHCL